jgi:quercetin dioxygenase-like cupin family protein
MILIAAGTLFASAALADAPLLRSSALSWEEIQARPSPNRGRTLPLFQAPTATLDELEMHVTTLPPREASHPPHQHPDEEIVIVKEGVVEALVGGENRRLGPGSVIFQASNEPHGLKNAGDVPAVYHVIRWRSPGMLKGKEPR